MAKKKVKKSKNRSEVETANIKESKAVPSDPTQGPPFNPNRNAQEVNTQVEVSKGALGDSFQTNSRP